MTIPQQAIEGLAKQGHALVAVFGRYVSTIKSSGGQDRYVLLRYEDGHFFVI